MTQLKISDIHYHPDASALFEQLLDLPQPCWLDSGRPWSPFGRYDIITAQPDVLLTTRGDCTDISSASGNKHATDNPFDLIREHLSPLRITARGNTAALPFCGGALGYFSYDLGAFDTGRKYTRLTPAAATDISLPDMHIGIYSWAIVQDHRQRRAQLICLPSCSDNIRREILGRLKKVGRPAKLEEQRSEKRIGEFAVGAFKSNLSRASYREKLLKIDDYINAGDCYQVNFAQRFSASFSGSSYAAYRRLRRSLPSPFSAYLELDHPALKPQHRCAVLSLSPERFLHLSGRHVETKPIKGTLPRGRTPQQDRLNAQALRTSLKDRAENVMIVDLLRNDLGKNCQIGSVRVPELFALESFPNVHHLVSTVTGTLDNDKTPLDLLQGCFPGGSITGAPKLRAMEIIAELEPHHRSVYCGSIGYLSANGNMDTNIAIRTLVCDRDRIHCWGGGGIVADSEPEKEYAESLAKIQILMDCLTKN